MARKNKALKEEAVKLREGGMKKKEIIDKTGLSRATLTLLFNKKGLINNKLSLSHVITDPPVNGDFPVTGDTKDPESKPTSEKVKLNSEPKSVEENSMLNIHAEFDNKSGGLLLKQGSFNKIENKPESTAGSSVIKPSENSVGLSDSIVEKPHELETLKSNLIGVLLPAVLLGAGLLMSGKKGMKGEFREENNGGNW